MAPTSTSPTACLTPRWLSEVTGPTPRRPRLISWRRKAIQTCRSSAGPTSTLEHPPLASWLDANRDQDRHRDHAAVLAHLLERGIQHQIGVLIVERTGPKSVDLGIELLA